MLYGRTDGLIERQYRIVGVAQTAPAKQPVLNYLGFERSEPAKPWQFEALRHAVKKFFGVLITSHACMVSIDLRRQIQIVRPLIKVI